VIQNHADRSTANSGQAAVIQPQAAVKVAHTEPVPAIKSHGPSEVAHAVQRTSAPTEPVKVAVPAVSSKPLQVASVDSAAGKLPLMHKHVLTGTLSLTPPAAVATVRTPQASSAQPAPTEPAISEPLSMNSGLKSPLFFSEGDVTVVSYSAAGDTIETDDGRSFVVGATVSVSTATSWDDYRANIHYRCDQNGNCTLTRSGVIALNAKLI
jgi:hypothetical protein